MATNKTTAKKTTAKKSTVSKKAQKKADTTPLQGLTNKVVDATDASLGFYGTLFDVMQDSLATVRKEAPKQLDNYIARGQKIRKDLGKAIEQRDFPASFNKDEIREQVESAIEKVKTVLTPSKA